MTDWDELDDDLASIMEETPVGENHGTSLASIPTSHGVTGAEPDDSSSIVYAKTSPLAPRRTLNTRDHEAKNATQGVTSDEREFHYLGMTAHRGVLHPDEYVDHEALIFAVEMRLGVTLEEVAEAFRAGNPDAARLKVKNYIEDQLLELEEAGGNMSLLASILGWTVWPNGVSRTMRKALKRARSRRDRT